jgi:hypothetical protein
MAKTFKESHLAPLRLHNQGLSAIRFSTPEQVVGWLCAVQAQDYLGALWTVGQRLKQSSETLIEDAIANKKIVRTWPMRGTLHFILADDVRWMLRLLTPRVVKRAESLYKGQGLDSKIFSKSRKLIEKALASGGQLTRAEIYEVLERGKISVHEQRGIHIINHAAQEGLICLGPRSGKQHTFVLLDDWIPKSKHLTEEEALAELAERYFESHGPATFQDFVWWSGLTLSEVKRAVQIVGDKLTSFTIDDTTYWTKGDKLDEKIKPPKVSLLSWFDEYIIGYTDRSAAFDPATAKYIVKPKNGLYSAVILINGKIAGNWKRIISKNDVQIDLTPFRKFTAAEQKALDKEIKRYKAFLAKD